jgi:hypothetical protein
MRMHASQRESPASAPVPARVLPAADVLSAPGSPLDAASRFGAEQRLGQDFSGVRIHADARAGAAADALRADAYAIGDHIVFAAGRFAPGTAAGDRLLAHELAHVVQQRPRSDAAPTDAAQAEREADAAARVPYRPTRLSRRPVAVHRQPVKASPPAGITRTELATKLKAILGHDVKITVGDKARQTKELGGPPAKRKLPDTWKAWDPGASAPLYGEILTAFSDVGREVGGVPDITEIVFYKVDYGWDENDNVVSAPNVPAAIRGRVINVYEGALFPAQIVAGGSGLQTSGIFLSEARSTAKKPAALVGGSVALSQRRGIAHELGHGIEARTGSLKEFEQAIGWSRVGGGLQLYDIQAKGVKAAITKGTAPPASALITQQNWNSGTHGEQPMRAYAVTDSTEDFADSLMAWTYTRDALKKRSPARFKFFEDQARRSGWLPKLVKPGGAAPVPGSGSGSGGP